jgi:capsule polysaccharide modification protein KpsS
MLPDFGIRHALFLQGPVGPFFRRRADEFRARGARVTKVNFNAGDGLFFRGPEVVRFRRPLEEWSEFLRTLLEEREIDALFLFGDCRPMHKDAVQLARDLGIAVWVFEEGYLRPDYITLELGGVNGNSTICKDPEFYRLAAEGLPELPDPKRIGQIVFTGGGYAALHSIAVTLLWWRYPHYRHHRNINILLQVPLWARGYWRKFWFGVRERGLIEKFAQSWSGKYFFVPLQVHNDAQIQHSQYRDIEEFIEQVVAAFAAHAPADALLVFKHHPHDRPYRDYKRLLRTLGERYGCADRLVYVHDLHLPTLLQNARGVVVMNSTVGLSSLHHATPVKVLGKAVYDIPGLTYQGSLEEFFGEIARVDTALYMNFHRWLRETSQFNGSFYKRDLMFIDEDGARRWWERFDAERDQQRDPSP